MDIGMIGLGRMGANMAQRLARGGHRVVGFARNASSRKRVEEQGVASAASLGELVAKLEPPRLLWLMIPAGAPVDAAIAELQSLVSAGDVLVDGGNSNYKDTLRRAALLAQKEIHYVDCGTSGGVWGLAGGYSLMIGGDAAAV